MAAIAEELGQLGSHARASRAEADRVDEAIAAAEKARDNDVAGLADLEQRLTAADEAPEAEPDTTERERLADVARLARQAEMEARLALRTGEERARALHGRADGLRKAAEQERIAQARAKERRKRRISEARAADAVGKGAHVVLARLERSLADAVERRTRIEHGRSGREQDLSATRARVRELETELAMLTYTVHRDEMLRTEHRLRMEQLEQRALDELGLDLESLVSEYGPDQLVPPPPALPDEDREVEPQPRPYVREEQQKRLRTAERALAQLGRINPLALEEFSALEERHKFLSEQLDDLRKTRRDLAPHRRGLRIAVQEEQRRAAAATPHADGRFDGVDLRRLEAFEHAARLPTVPVAGNRVCK